MRLRMREIIQKLEFRNLFLPASCKVASFPLVLDLMHVYYVILFPDVFQFFIWRHSGFVVHFHISSQQLQGKGISVLFFTLRKRENNEKLKLSSTNKTRFFFVSNFWCGVCSSNQKKVWLNFRKLTKSFVEPFLRDFLWFQRAFLPGNININTLAVFFSFFISNLTCCICTNKIYISNRFIVICHTSLYCLIPIFLLKCC